MSWGSCAAAAGGGHIPALTWLRGRGHEWDRLTSMSAARNGRLELLRHALEAGCPYHHDVPARAAWGGHLEVLEWLRREGYEWGPATCESAVAAGQLHVLIWAAGEGCPLGDIRSAARMCTDPNTLAWVEDELRKGAQGR